MDTVRRRLCEHRFSPRTCEAYVHWIRRYIRFHGRRHPKELAEPEVGVFLFRPLRLPDSAPAIRITVGLRDAPESWRDYLYWNLELDES